MKLSFRILALYLAAVLAGGVTEVACAQTTLVEAVAPGIQMGGVPITQGVAVFVPVDSYGHTIPVTVPGAGLNIPAGGTKPLGYSCALVAGVITGCPVPDQNLSSPAHFAYNVTITDTSSTDAAYGYSFTLTQVGGVTGSSFRLDQYTATASVPTTSALTFTTGAGAPTGACTAPALYSTTGGSMYVCASGAWLPVVGSGAGITQLTGDISTAAGSGSQSATLASVNSTPGACGDATHVCQVTTDIKGRTLAQSAVAITGTGGGSGIAVPPGFPQQLLGFSGADHSVYTGWFVVGRCRIRRPVQHCVCQRGVLDRGFRLSLGRFYGTVDWPVAWGKPRVYGSICGKSDYHEHLPVVGVSVH